MKTGFIGCGGFAGGTHIPNTIKNPNIEVRAFCDLNKTLLDNLQQKFPVDYVTTDMMKVFEDPKIEAVICSTKPDVRMPIMEAAVKYGKHLFVEKPLCYDDAQINDMIKLINGSGINFMVGFNRPYSPLMQDAKNSINSTRRAIPLSYTVLSAKASSYGPFTITMQSSIKANRR